MYIHSLYHTVIRITFGSRARRLSASVPCGLRPEGLQETARAGPARGSLGKKPEEKPRLSNLGQGGGGGWRRGAGLKCERRGFDGGRGTPSLGQHAPSHEGPRGAMYKAQSLRACVHAFQTRNRLRSGRESIYIYIYIYIYIHMPSYYHAPASSSPFLTYLLLLKKKKYLFF